MTRENILFAIIGILLGFIVGFMFASSMSQRMPEPQARSQAMPADHPPVGAQQNGAAGDPQAVREQVASGINLVIQIARLQDGTRRLTHISEVVGTAR